MRRLWHRSGWARAGVAAALLSSALLLVPFLLPIDRFRPLVVRFLEDRIGRHVEIGSIRLHLLPTIHLEVANIRVKNPAGFPPGDAVVVRSLGAGLRVRGLLARRLIINRVSAKGVRLNLLWDPRGRTNVDPSPRSRPAAPRPAVGARSSPPIALDRIDSVAISDVEITGAAYDPRRGVVARVFDVAGLNARIGGIDPAAPDMLKALTIAANLDGVKFRTPALASPIVIGPGVFTVKDRGGRGTLAASMDTIRSDIEIHAVDLGRKPVEFALAVPELDLARLKALIRGGPQSAGSPAGPSGRNVLAAGTVKIGRLILAPLRAEQVVSRMSVYADRIDVDAYRLLFYGGAVKGSGRLEYAAATQPAFLTATVRGVDVARLATAAAPPGAHKITGTLDADARLVTAFSKDPLTALAGAGTFAVRNGTLPGLRLNNTLVGMARLAQVSLPADDMTLRVIGGDFRISRQRVYTDATRLDAGGLAASARGSVGFDRSLDLGGIGVLRNAAERPRGGSHLDPSLLAAGSILGSFTPGSRIRQPLGSVETVRVPFSLRGTFDNPTFALAGSPTILGSGGQPVQPMASPRSGSGVEDLLKLFR
jgi:hypothetical protein